MGIWPHTLRPVLHASDVHCSCVDSRLEDDEGLVLTPFEKNLEVWRQLWRVLERSDIVVQASLNMHFAHLFCYVAKLSASHVQSTVQNAEQCSLCTQVRMLYAGFIC